MCTSRTTFGTIWTALFIEILRPHRDRDLQQRLWTARHFKPQHTLWISYKVRFWTRYFSVDRKHKVERVTRIPHLHIRSTRFWVILSCINIVQHLRWDAMEWTQWVVTVWWVCCCVRAFCVRAFCVRAFLHIDHNTHTHTHRFPTTTVLPTRLIQYTTHRTRVLNCEMLQQLWSPIRRHQHVR